MSKPLEFDNADLRNVILHAGINGIAVALVAIFTYLIPIISGSGPAGMIIAAVLSGLLVLLKRLIVTT